MTIELTIVNAIALEPGKVYILEYDRTKISAEQMRGVGRYLAQQGIKGVAVRSIDGHGLRVVEPEQERKDDDAADQR